MTWVVPVTVSAAWCQVLSVTVRVEEKAVPPVAVPDQKWPCSLLSVPM